MFKVYKKATYAGTFIIIRQVGVKYWEYILFKAGDFYSAYMVVKPQWWRMFFKNPYTDRQIQGICQRLVNMATATVDLLNKRRDKKEKEKRDGGENKQKRL